MIIRGNPLIMAGGGGSPAEKSIFGDGSDGIAVFSADTTWSADPEDTGMIVKNFESLTVEEGVTVAAGNRNCGMVIRVKGDCTIAGTLANRMSPKTILDSDGVNFSAYPLSMVAAATVAGAGGNGADGANIKGGNIGAGGIAMPGRFYGGGWGAGGGGGEGAVYASYSSFTPYGLSAGADGGSTINITTATTEPLFVGGGGGYGLNGTGTLGSNGGGGGGGGGGAKSEASGQWQYAYGGTGGTGPGADGTGGGYGAGWGGGAGNYGGGVVLLFVGGTLTISGEIDCSGGNGGLVGNATVGAGGGGGGGRIYIVYKGELINTGVLNVNGGTGGNAGGIGTTAVLAFEEDNAQEVA